MPRPRRRQALQLVLLVVAVLTATASTAAAALTVDDLGDGAPTATQLAESLAGAGVTVSNVSYTGAPVAAGTFAGGTGIIGFEDGVVLGSGSVASVIGPNVEDGKTTSNSLPGDADLDTLVGAESTHDAAVLAFDFVPGASTLTFSYVFSSDEYNEFVSEGVTTGVNDVFGFFVNGQNCALVPGTSDPVSINTINGGRPLGTTDPELGVVAKHPALYRNNDPSDGTPTIDTEMDGLTVVLTCTAAVNAGQTNRVKLAIADRGDSILDSNVFLQRGSFVAPTPDTTPPVAAVVTGPSGPVTSSALTFEFTANEAGSRFECSLDSGPFAPCASPYTTGMLAPGPHTFDVVAIDAAGNRGVAARRSFTVVPPPVADRDGDGIPDSQDTSDASAGPTLAKDVIARVVSGQVFYSLPRRGGARAAQVAGRNGLILLKGAEVIPLGSTIHTQRGRVQITSAAGTQNGRRQTQRADFYQGRFRIRQRRANKPITDIDLQAPNFAKLCGSSASRSRGFAARRRSKRVVSKLRGDGSGRFRTNGRNSAATVRGTRWLTEERCDGTRTTVFRGIVSVRDTKARRTVVLRAGRSYLARAQRAASRTR